tara:strand:+ start:551 stop:796 length:246 start_codon:yes stop_codon:yes gene_type:complete
MNNRIKICAGPGCRAWNAEFMAKRLQVMDKTTEVLVVTCMDKCGGGCSVRLKDRGKVFKLRERSELIDVIKGNEKALTQAY